MKALVISRNGNLHDEIAAAGSGRSPAMTVIAVRDGLLEASKQIAVEAPQLVIIDASPSDVADVGALERLSAEYPRTEFMLLTTDQSPEMLIRAMRAGVREVLALPLEQKALNDALNRLALKNASLGLKSGKILSFISCKGGSGATFLATNFGHALATRAQKKVLLIDLNQQFGDAALYVSEKKATMTLSDLCAQINRIDAGFLESSLITVSPGFGILAASDDPTRSVDIKPEHIDVILRLARNYYDFIILDVGRQIDTVTIRALDNSDLIYPVLQLALPYIRDGRRLLDIFRSLGYPKDKMRLIVNRLEKNGKLKLSDLEGALGRKPAHTVPNNFEAVSDSVNQGVPVLQLARSSPVAKSLIELVEQTAEQPAPESRGIFARFLGRPARQGT